MSKISSRKLQFLCVWLSHDSHCFFMTFSRLIHDGVHYVVHFISCFLGESMLRKIPCTFSFGCPWDLTGDLDDSKDSHDDMYVASSPLHKCFGLEPGSKQQTVGSRQQPAGSMKQQSASMQQSAGSRYWAQAAGSKQQQIPNLVTGKSYYYLYIYIY